MRARRQRKAGQLCLVFASRRQDNTIDSIPAASLQPSDNHERYGIKTKRHDAVDDPVRATQGNHSHCRLRRIRCTQKASAALGQQQASMTIPTHTGTHAAASKRSQPTECGERKFSVQTVHERQKNTVIDLQRSGITSSVCRTTYLHQEDGDRFCTELPRKVAEEDEEHEHSQTERIVHACSTLRRRKQRRNIICGS